MKNKYILPIIIAAGSALMTTSCTDYAQSEPEMVSPVTFKGSVWDYLETEHPDMKFDSIRAIVEEIPELKAQLTTNGEGLTFFAPTDASVRHAIEALNLYRKSNKIGEPVYLKDLMIEPFEVEDTIIRVNPLTLENDTTFSYRKYDYRLQLDSLVSRYAFSERVLADYVIDTGGRIKMSTSRYTQEMILESGRHDAYGASEAGIKYLYLVESNGSNMQSSWVKAEAAKRDIETTNGIVHVLSDSHEFGFNLFIKKFKDRGTEKGVKTIL